MLSWFGYDCRWVETTYGLEDCAPRILLIDLENGEGVHAVVVADGVVYNPDCGCNGYVDLAYIGWHGIGMFLEVKPYAGVVAQ